MAATDTSSPNSTIPTPDEKTMKEEYKRTAFDKEFRLLIKQARETIEARYGTAIELGDEPFELTCLNKYFTIYTDNTEPENHYCYFETLYNRHRSSILDTLNDDHWLRKPGLYIQFGEGFKGIDQKSSRIRMMRIMLSEIFSIAFHLQQNAEKAFDGIDEQFRGTASKDLIRPNILLLHLMRIFYHLNNNDDKTQLGVIVTQLEKDLGVTKKTVGSEPWKMVATTAPPAGIGGGIAPIFTMATEMMEKMGYKPPPEMKPPSEAEIQNAITSVFYNPVTQSAIQNMFSGVNNCQDFGSILQHVVKNVTDPATMGAIQETINENTQFGAPNP